IKTSLLAAALGLAFGAFLLSCHFRVDSALEALKTGAWRNAFSRPGETERVFLKAIADTRAVALRDTLTVGGMAVLAAFAGGLWTTILFRQTTAAFWTAFLIPMFVAMLLSSFPEGVARTGLLVVIVVCAVLGVIWATRFFRTVQDTQWTGGILSLPA